MKDIVYVRKYTDQKGQERKEYITVGYMFEKEGRTSILMKPYINPAALTNEKGEVWLSVYEHKTKEQKQAKNVEYKGEGVATMAEVVNKGQSPEVLETPEEDYLPFN